jgi:ATP-dependent DNA helicase RecQ
VTILRSTRSRGISRTALSREAGLAPGLTDRILGGLLGLDVARSDGFRRFTPGASHLTPEDAAAALVTWEERRHSVERSRVEQVGAYAAAQGCRRRFILATFGHAYQSPCGACDRCHAEAAGDAPDAGRPDDAPRDDVERYPVGSAVRHVTWGLGHVERVDRAAIAVRFESVGHRTLSLELVEDGGLLLPADEAPSEAA